jgi:hypothetical protein
MQPANATPRSRGMKSFEVKSGDRAAADSVRRGGGKSSLAVRRMGVMGVDSGEKSSGRLEVEKTGVEKGKERPCASTGSRLTHPTPASNFNSLANYPHQPACSIGAWLALMPRLSSLCLTALLSLSRCTRKATLHHGDPQQRCTGTCSACPHRKLAHPPKSKASEIRHPPQTTRVRKGEGIYES